MKATINSSKFNFARQSFVIAPFVKSSQTFPPSKFCASYRIRQNFRGFRGFLANRESFPLESFAVYST